MRCYTVVQLSLGDRCMLLCKSLPARSMLLFATHGSILPLWDGLLFYSCQTELPDLTIRKPETPRTITKAAQGCMLVVVVAIVVGVSCLRWLYFGYSI